MDFHIYREEVLIFLLCIYSIILNLKWEERHFKRDLNFVQTTRKAYEIIELNRLTSFFLCQILRQFAATKDVQDSHRRYRGTTDNRDNTCDMPRLSGQISMRVSRTHTHTHRSSRAMRILCGLFMTLPHPMHGQDRGQQQVAVNQSPLS